MTRVQDGGKVVSLRHRPPLPPGNTPGTHYILPFRYNQFSPFWNLTPSVRRLVPFLIIKISRIPQHFKPTVYPTFILVVQIVYSTTSNASLFFLINENTELGTTNNQTFTTASRDWQVTSDRHCLVRYPYTPTAASMMTTRRHWDFLELYRQHSRKPGLPITSSCFLNFTDLLSTLFKCYLLVCSNAASILYWRVCVRPAHRSYSLFNTRDVSRRKHRFSQNTRFFSPHSLLSTGRHLLCV
jgi:hypothetical protein